MRKQKLSLLLLLKQYKLRKNKSSQKTFLAPLMSEASSNTIYVSKKEEFQVVKWEITVKSDQ